MKKLAIAFAAVVLYAGAAFAGPACEGTVDEAGNKACGECVVTPSGESTTGCIALSGDPGSICIGGDAETGQGCAAAQDASGEGIFVCNTAAGPAPCDETACREAAAAACGG